MSDLFWKAVGHFGRCTTHISAIWSFNRQMDAANLKLCTIHITCENGFLILFYILIPIQYTPHVRMVF